MTSEPFAKETPLSFWMELPVNPNLFLLHTKLQLTQEMSESYDLTTPPRENIPTWLRPFWEISGLTRLQILRHHLRFRKEKSLSWESLIPLIQQKLNELAHELRWNELDGRLGKEPKKRTWVLSSQWTTSQRLVYEGFAQAQEHPLAQSFFAFHGLTSMLLYQGELTLKRGLAFSWEELLPHIEEALQAHNA